MSARLALVPDAVHPVDLLEELARLREENTHLRARCTELHAQARTAQRQTREEARALQAAWEERALTHEDLTALGVPPGELRWRVAYLAGQRGGVEDPWTDGEGA